MSNQLAIPFKKTTDVPLKDVIREFFLSHFTDTHPDAFQWDVARWQELRKASSNGSVHVDKIDIILEYHAQLVFILTKLPQDIGLEIPYSPSLVNSSIYVTLQNLHYERISILFNLAALHSLLAFSENRSHAEGLKRAIMFYQKAAGTFSYIVDSALPAFKQSLSDHEQPLEYTRSFLKALEYIMLAQGQECAWQRAIMDNFKNGLIAKISARVSSLYGLALQTIKESSPSVYNTFPAEWIFHIEIKHLHFDAAAQYRRSLDDSEGYRYGHELARLSAANSKAKAGYDLARKNLASRPVTDDIKSLLDIVQKNINRAERDNDLIYHQDVPATSALPIIQEVTLAQSIILPNLLDPKNALGEKGLIFGGLVGWGASMAIDIYRDRVQNWLKEEIYSHITELDSNVTQVLQSLNLPASLEALDRPIGLPQSLLRKAEEVRLEDGPARIEKCFESAEMLSERIQAALNEAMDLLDQEAAEDEVIRNKLLKNGTADRRLPSDEVNQDFIAKERRYREVLSQAAESDIQVRAKWDKWEATIIRLTWKEDDLEKWVPSSTVSRSGGPLMNAETQKHARGLRVHIEELDDLQRARVNLMQRAQRLAEAEDIKPRIMREASAIESWIEVNPTMFEDSLDQEMGKYEKFKESIEENASRQVDLLEAIKSQNQLFLDSRQTDQSVKDRAHTLQSLDLAYHKYREIKRNLDEGLKFYNDLASIVTEFRERCKEFVTSRRAEIYDLSQSLQSMALVDNGGVVEHTFNNGADVSHYPTGTNQPQAHTTNNLTLPPLDSSEWESVQLPSPVPTPAPIRARKTTSQRRNNRQ